MKQKRWLVAPRLDSDLFTHLLLSRQITPDQQGAFFAPTLTQLLSPHDFPDMPEAVRRIQAALEAEEPMVVWGDFDCDGVTSTAILWETLYELGAKVKPYIPNRDAEGHGFNRAALEKLAAEGIKLIVTCDHGITAFDDVVLARNLGMDVIISDHHEPRELADESARAPVGERDDSPTPDSQLTTYTLPEAVAVIHPFRLAQPQQLAGCGTAYFLAYAVWLAVKGRPDDAASRAAFAEGRIELAALGTIADMMPLVGDNRVFAAVGLQALARTRRLGLQQMMALASLKPQDTLSVYDVGFILAPRLNAPGRLADALESLRLLCTKDAGRASLLAGALHDLNKERQELLAVVTKEATAAAAARGEQGFYLFSSPDWPAGVCGLAAGRLVEALYRPVVVMEEQGEQTRGSARSIAGFDITAGLRSVADLLERYGGHSMAAGFVAKTVHLPEIERRLSEMVLAQLSPEELTPRLNIDAEAQLSELGWTLWDQLRQLEPCGLGNPQPVLVSYGVSVLECRAIGQEGKHLKLAVQLSSQPATSAGRLPTPDSRLDAVAFNLGHWCNQLTPGTLVDLVYQLDENVWQGRRSLQLKVKDVRLSESYSG